MRDLSENFQRGPGHDIVMRMVKSIEFAVFVMAFIAIWLDYYSADVYGGEFGIQGQILFIAAYSLTLIIFARTYEAFTISIQSLSELFFSQIITLLVTDGIFYVFIAFLLRDFPDVLPFVGLVGSQSIVSIAWCTITYNWYYRSFRKYNAIIFYDEDHNLREVTDQELFNKKFVNCGTFDIEDLPKDRDQAKEWLISKIRDCEAVFIMEMKSSDRNIVLKYCIEHGIRVYCEPKLSDLILSRAKKMNMYNLPFFLAQRYSPNLEYQVLKRVFDIIMSLLALIILSPVMLITAIAVKSYDKGPAIYKQKRLTKDGKVFDIYKFRSMRVDAEKESGAVISTGEADPRVTPVGRVLRKYRLDEFPQFLNILKGDMSFVGPRPERPEIANELMKTLPEFNLRLQVRAGLTGYAQIHGKYDADSYDKLSMDLLYISRAGVAEDIVLIFATIKRILVSGGKDKGGGA